MDTLSEQVRDAIRNNAGASQADVARHCRLSPSGVSRFMSGKAGLSLPAVERLSQCLRLRLVSEKEWLRREAVWGMYQNGELRRKWDEF
jgi:transcriptional regulator with XRE-family HTH domain